MLFSHFRLLLLRLAIAMAFFSLYRIVFYLCNHATLGDLSAAQWCWVWVGGWRFDLSAVLYTNLLFVLLHLLPLKSRDTRWWQKISFVVFMVFNAIAMAIEWGDIAYFPFNFRRLLKADLAMQQDAQQQLPTFIHDYWYMFLGYFVVLYFLYRLYKLTLPKRTDKVLIYPKSIVYYGSQILIMFLSAGLAVIGLRGGLQMKPLSPLHAGMYVSDKRQMPLVANTTLNLILSFEQRSLKPVRYFTDKQALENIYTLRHEPDTTVPFKKMNVVVLILESFGKELTGVYNPQYSESYTPFFDSLTRQCASFTHAYANGTRSIQGVTSVLSGIPYLMPDPFTWSAYQSNRISSIGGELKKQGYQTGFFHGGHNGTMNFDRYCAAADINHYYGMNEYNTEYPGNKDFDQSWGIWDDKFFDFFIKKINTEFSAAPFCVTYFTLMPHPPFVVEEWFRKAHPNTPTGRPLAQLYADYCLSRFFKKLEQTSWFKNTLFVLSADHIGQPLIHADYNTPEARYKIPVLFYCPSDTSLHGQHNGLIQQVDIGPTALKYLHYPSPYYSFGKALDLHTDDNENYHFVYTGDLYQITNGQYLLQSNGDMALGLFDLVHDPACTKDIKTEVPDITQHLNQHLQAVLQTHYNAMRYNQITQ